MKNVFRDQLKNLKRNIRYFLVNSAVRFISAQPVSVLPKILNLLLKLVPIFFQKEINRARELIPPEFAGKVDSIVKEMARNQMLNLLDVFFYEKLAATYPDFITVKGKEIFSEAFEKGRGVIVLSAHFGSWELIGYTIARLGYPINVIARPQAINRMTELMNSFRSTRGVKVLMDNNLSASLRRLKKGEVLGIVADLNARERGYRVSFFGREASFYPTPVLLSARSGAPLIPVFIERASMKKHVLRFEEPIQWQPGETVSQRVQKYVSVFESAFRQRPDHWVWFHERYEYSSLGKTD